MLYQLLCVASALFSDKPKMYGKIFQHCLSNVVYNWRETSGQTLNLASVNQCSHSDKMRVSISEAKVNILSVSPLPLSNIKTGSLDLLSWHLFRNTGISSRFNGIYGILSSSRAFWMFPLIVLIESELQWHLQRYCPIVCLEFSVVFLLLF